MMRQLFHVLISLVSVGEDVREYLRTNDRVRELEKGLKASSSHERSTMLMRAAKY